MRKTLPLFLCLLFCFSICHAQINIETETLSSPSFCNGELITTTTISNDGKTKTEAFVLEFDSNDGVLISQGETLLPENVIFQSPDVLIIPAMAPCEVINIDLVFSLPNCFQKNETCLNIKSIHQESLICTKVEQELFAINDLQIRRQGNKRYIRTFKISNIGTTSFDKLFLRYSASGDYQVLNKNFGDFDGNFDIFDESDFVQIGNKDSQIDPGEEIEINQILQINQCTSNIIDSLAIVVDCGSGPCKETYNQEMTIFHLSNVLNGFNLNTQITAYEKGSDCRQLVMRGFAVGVSLDYYRNLEFLIQIKNNGNISTADSVKFIQSGTVVSAGNNDTISIKTLSIENDRLVAEDGDGKYNDLALNDTLFFEFYTNLQDDISQEAEVTAFVFYENECGNKSFGRTVSRANFDANSRVTIGSRLDLTNDFNKIIRHPYDGDTARLNITNNFPVFNTCEQFSYDLQFIIPPTFKPLGDSLKYIVSSTTTFDSIIEEMGGFPFFTTYTYGSYPFTVFNDTISMHFDDRNTAQRQFFLDLVAIGGVSYPNGDACTTCLQPDSTQIIFTSSYKCQNSCINEISHSNESNPQIISGNTFVSYATKADRNKIEKPLWLIDSSYLIVKTGIFEDNFANKPIEFGINSIISGNDDLEDVALVLYDDDCNLESSDTIIFSAYYSDKDNYFSNFDPNVELKLLKKDGTMISEILAPHRISVPVISVYELVSNVQKYDYNLTAFIQSNSMASGDSLYITRVLKANTTFNNQVRSRAHEITSIGTECSKTYGQKLLQNFNRAAPKLALDIRAFKSQRYRNEWFTLANHPLSRLVMDFNFLAYYSKESNYQGFKSLVVPTNVTFTIPRQSYLQIDTVKNEQINTRLPTRSFNNGQNIDYEIDSIKLVDHSHSLNEYYIPMRYLHYLNQNDTIPFTYNYREKLTDGSYLSKSFSTSKIVSSIKYQYLIQNKVQINKVDSASWPILYTHESINDLTLTGDLRDPNSFILQNNWVLLKPSLSNLALTLFDRDRDSVINPIATKDGYLLYQFDSLQIERNLELSAKNYNCQPLEIEYYTASCSENPLNYLDFFISNAGGIFKKNTLRVVVQNPTFESKLQVRSINNQKCGEIRLTGSFVNFTNKTANVVGVVLEKPTGFTITKAETFKNNNLQNVSISQDTMWFNTFIMLDGFGNDSLKYTIDAAIPCPYYDEQDFVVNLLQLDECGNAVTVPIVLNAVNLFPDAVQTNVKFGIEFQAVSARCNKQVTLNAAISHGSDLSAGDVILLSPPSEDNFSNLIPKIDPKIAKFSLVNNQLVINLLEPLAAGNTLAFSVDYEKNCSVSCEATNWSIDYYKSEELNCKADCFILSKHLTESLPIDFSLDLAGLSKDTVWSDLSGIHFEFKPNGKTYNDTVQVELYSDVDANGQITDQDILYNSGNALLFNDVDGNPYLLFTSSNSRACNLLARITADCSCDTLIFDFVLPQAEPTPIVYPVCILDPLTFTLPNLNAQEVVWPNSDFLSETSKTGAVYTNPEITADDTVRIQFIDEFGCTLTFPLVFTPGIKDLEVQIIKPENCDADATSKITLSTQSMLNNVSINGVMQDDTAQLYLPAGEHILVLTDNLNCMVQRTISIDSLLNPQIQSIIAVAPTCSGGQNGTATISLSFESERFTYFIDKQPIDTLFTNQLSPGSHLFEVVDSLGCKDSLNFEVLNRMPFLAKTDSLEAICDGLTVDFSNLIFENGTASYSYSFDSIFFTDQIRRTLDLFNEDTTLFVRDKNGCTVSFPIHLTNKPKSYLEVFTDTVLAYGTVLELGIQNPAEFPDLTWVSDQMLSCISCPNPNLVVEAYTTILLKGLDTDQCEDSIKIEIRLLEVNLENIFPNVFVPSSGTENNVFKIEKNNLIHSIEAFEVFDRYGNSVFQQSNADEVSWDGNFGGKPCAEGVYVFQTAVTINDPEKTKKQFTGTITLIR